MDLYIENINISDRFNNSSVKYVLSDIPNSSGQERQPDILLIKSDSISLAQAVTKKEVPRVLNFANNERAGEWTKLN